MTRPLVIALDDSVARVNMLRGWLDGRAELQHVTTVLEMIELLSRYRPPALVLLGDVSDRDGHTGIDAARAYRGEAQVIVWSTDPGAAPHMVADLTRRAMRVAWVPAWDEVNLAYHVGRYVEDAA